MKIGIIIGENLPSYWAHSFNVMKMAQGFQNNGCQVEVITAKSKVTQKNRKKIKDMYAHYGVSRDIKVKYLSPSSKAYENGVTRNDHIFAERAVKYAKERNFDLVYCRNTLLIPYLTAKSGLPTLLETHGKNSFLQNPTWKEMYNEVIHIKSFAGVVTIHQDLKQGHVNEGLSREKILVLEDGVDLKPFNKIPQGKLFWRKQLGLKKKMSYAVYCGHLYKEKGIKVIMKAAKRLRKRKNLKFLLVGGLKKDQKKWQTYCQRKSIRNVKFAGFVPNWMVPRYLKTASVLLLPYQLKNINYKIMDINTTSPLKLFEYMAARKPIVATQIPTIAKILRHRSNAMLVEPDSIKEYVKNIEKVLDDKTLRVAISIQAYEDVKKYTWDVRCSSILNYFKPI
jgi:glycosyltransferase involved in cell wall biosynthesis